MRHKNDLKTLKPSETTHKETSNTKRHTKEKLSTFSMLHVRTVLSVHISQAGNSITLFSNKYSKSERNNPEVCL